MVRFIFLVGPFRIDSANRCLIPSNSDFFDLRIDADMQALLRCIGIPIINVHLRRQVTISDLRRILVRPWVDLWWIWDGSGMDLGWIWVWI